MQTENLEKSPGFSQIVPPATHGGGGKPTLNDGDSGLSPVMDGKLVQSGQKCEGNGYTRVDSFQVNLLKLPKMCP